MGITANCAKFLFYAKQNNVSFETTLTLGRQHLYASDKELSNYSNKYLGVTSSIRSANNYAEPLFELLGARLVDSIDYSNYEQATLLHDLNQPVPRHMHNRYSCIFDGGTLEHVFNVPVALHNLMCMLKQGGHIVSITPANNQCGHGFYQFSPELFFSVFHRSNGFCVNSLFLAPDSADENGRTWYEVKNPAEVGGRVTFRNDAPTYIMLLAQKIDSQVPETITAFQSDYVSVWTKDQQGEESPHGKVKMLYRSLFPKKIRDFLHKVFRKKNVQHNILGLGVGNSNHFRKVNF
jgi:hypothetical protein